MQHAEFGGYMPKLVPDRNRRQKSGGRQTGTPNRITADIRQALRMLAEGNAHRVQEWLDRVAENDPAEALRLWLALLRFVTPTLQAAAIADLTPSKSASLRLAALTDEQLMEAIVQSPEARALAQQGVKTKEELVKRLAAPPSALVAAGTAGRSVDDLLL